MDKDLNQLKITSESVSIVFAKPARDATNALSVKPLTPWLSPVTLTLKLFAQITSFQWVLKADQSGFFTDMQHFA